MEFAFHDETLDQAALHLEESHEKLLTARMLWPEDVEVARLWALDASKRGKAEQARGHFEQARADFLEAVRALELPAAHTPDLEEDRRALAVSLHEIATVGGPARTDGRRAGILP